MDSNAGAKLIADANLAHTLRFTGPGVAPMRCHPTDAGYDLHVYLDPTTWEAPRVFLSPNPGQKPCVVLSPGESADMPCGISVRFPTGWYGRITARSSTLRRGLTVAEGVIDEGYTGPLFCFTTNTTERDVVVSHGDRLGQLLLLPTPPHFEIRRVADLGATDRGDRGFGSTGI